MFRVVGAKTLNFERMNNHTSCSHVFVFMHIDTYWDENFAIAKLSPLRVYTHMKFVTTPIYCHQI